MKKLSMLKILRFLLAYVFITSGIMKLISSELAQSFIQLKLPYPLQLMYLIAAVEILCGVLFIVNKEVKNATIPLIGIMIAALILTKLPIISSGFIPFLFQARLDLCMLTLLIFLYVNSDINH